MCCVTKKLSWIVVLVLMIGCSGGGSGSDPGSTPTWSISIDTTDSGTALNPALLGHYDLSGALYDYADVPGLSSAMDAVNFTEWRIGAGRWEQATELLPTLTNGFTCPGTSGIPAAIATTDEELMAARDWFTYTGATPVTLLDTLDDDRYFLDYIRSVIDVADSFGAEPFISIDHMPRALAINQDANREDCGTTFMNAVSNNEPADTAVFVNAVAGLVERVVEGSGTKTGHERPRSVIRWEVWNEPELPYFWDPAFPGTFFNMAGSVLAGLDAYRTNSGMSELKFGLASFAISDSAIATISSFDGIPIPMDFISFHGYNDDPLVIVAYIEQVVAAAQNSVNYQDIEIILAEWGPDLATRAGDQTYAASMAPPLHAATVVALGAAAGLDRAHKALFYEYHAAVALGLINNAGQPRSLYRGYELMAKVIQPGAVRLSLTGLADGKLDAGMGAVLVSRDGTGTVRALLVNRNAGERTLTIELNGTATTPNTIYAFDGSDDPLDPLRVITPSSPDVTMPGNALMVLEF